MERYLKRAFCLLLTLGLVHFSLQLIFSDKNLKAMNKYVLGVFFDTNFTTIANVTNLPQRIEGISIISRKAVSSEDELYVKTEFQLNFRLLDIYQEENKLSTANLIKEQLKPIKCRMIRKIREEGSVKHQLDNFNIGYLSVFQDMAGNIITTQKVGFTLCENDN